MGTPEGSDQEPRTVMEVVRRSAEYLDARGVENARLDAELLLAGVLGTSRLDLYLQFDRPLQPEELGRMRERLRRRGRREPLQYIEGTAAFRGLDLQVDRRVLIPRPETEVLVDRVLSWMEGRDGLEIVDIGTGSGAIALSLAAESRPSRIVATDLSGEALSVAAANLERISPPSPVDLRQGAGYAPIEGERFDVIVSNPPYIAQPDREGLAAEVREWEPSNALFSGDEGLDVITGLVDGAAEHLRPRGLLALEIGADQGADAMAMARGTAAFATVRIVPDLAGRDRILLAEAE